MPSNDIAKAADFYKIAIEEASILMALYVGPEIRIVIANKLMLSSWNKDASIIGKTLREANPEFEGQPFFEYFDRVFQTGEEYVAVEEPAQLYSNGEHRTFYFNFNYKPIKHSDGSVWGIVHTALDVTEQVLAKQKLERTRERLKLAIESAELGTWFLDGSKGTIGASDRSKRLFGYNHDEFLSLDAVLAQIPGHHRQSISDTIERAFEDGQSHDVEFPVTGYHDKVVRWIKATGKVFYKEDKTPFLSGTLMDITTQRLIQQRKDEFISVASHELKTPLTSVIAGYQLLQRQLFKNQAFGKPIETLSETVNANLNRLKSLVDVLLDVGKVQNQVIVLHKTHFPAQQIIDRCCQHILGVGTHALQVTGQPYTVLYADENRLEQVVSNLLNNAVKYAPDATHIVIDVADLGDRVKFSVQDFGIGISSDEAKQVFNRFYRSGMVKAEVSGLGLGLYISADIVKNHGGVIGVDSELGLGSTFWFTIPKQKRRDHFKASA